jgi:hypothetical protein
MAERQTIADQLQALGPRLRRSVPEIRTVNQLELEISGSSSELLFDACREIILHWINSRSGRPLPRHAWDGMSFQLEDIGAQFAAAIALKEPKFWAARLDDADRNVPRRSWITEIELAPVGAGSLLLGSRLLCVSRQENPTYQPSIPAFIRQIANLHEIKLDGRAINDDPWILTTGQDVEEFIDLIQNPKRKHDVILFSLPDNGINPIETIFPIEWIRIATLGTTHIAVITGPASYRLTNALGKEFSVFRQAIRIYRPGLNVDQHQPFQHPLFLADKIRSWEGAGAQAFADYLIARAIGTTASDRERENRLPPFTQVRQIAARLEAEAARKSGAADSVLLELALKENQELQRELDEQKETYDGLLATTDGDAEVVRREGDEIKAQNASLRARIAYLESVVRQRAQERVEIPDSFETLEEWANKYLSGAVVIHNRALRAARKSEFEDIELAYNALLLLRDYYVPMRREGGIDKVESFKDACQQLKLEDSQTFSGARYGEEGDAYRIDYEGKRRLLDRHLKGSSSREERFGFRLYYFWDEDREEVVVGWLPTHLPNRIS